jgi:hypothetical protein
MNYSVILCASFLMLIASGARAQFKGNFDGPVSENPLVESYDFSSDTGFFSDERSASSSLAAVTLSHSFSRAYSPPALPGSKSPFLAAALSLVIPGAGEYYVGDQIWRGIIFTGIEAGLWIEWVHWNNLGDNSTASYHSFSEAHWSALKYADTLNTALVNDSLSALAIANPKDPNFLHSINQAEVTLDSLSITHTDLPDYTHRLIAGGQPEYYDLISTYLQYLPGWDSKNNYNAAGSLRTTANSQYGTAEALLWGIIANHFLSAIDAVLLASDHNTRLRLHGDLLRKQMPDGTYGYLPTASFEYSF